MRGITAGATAARLSTARVFVNSSRNHEDTLPGQDESQQKHGCHLHGLQCHDTQLIVLSRQSLLVVPDSRHEGNNSSSVAGVKKTVSLGVSALQTASGSSAGEVNAAIGRCRRDQTEDENENAFLHRTTDVETGRGRARGRSARRVRSSRAWFPGGPAPSQRSHQ